MKKMMYTIKGTKGATARTNIGQKEDPTRRIYMKLLT